MVNYSRITLLIIHLLLVVLSTEIIAYSESGRLRGIIKEADTGNPLVGANAFIMGSSMGSSSDNDGKYSINQIPFGKYKVRFTFLGYEPQIHEVEISSSKIVELNIELRVMVIEGEAVTITAQREGQIAAINRQLSSDAIKNVVSSDKIEELPEANAAEAVGRLPGISLLRSGGEGNKVVIRGLAPEFNRVQIDGIDMAATNSYDRSSDLSMLSPYMLGSIEVTKSAMANQNANQLGGTVNFVLKGAPEGEPTTKLLLEGGYNALKEKYNDYKFVAQHNRRLFDSKFGVSAVLDIEKRNRSSNSLSAGYEYLQEDSTTAINSLNLTDVTRELKRYNGSVIFDFKTENTNLKLSNMFSQADRETVERSESLSGLRIGASRNQNLTSTEGVSKVFMSKLSLDQTFDEFKINAGLSYTFSDGNVPEQFGFGGIEGTAIDKPVPYGTRPRDVPSYASEDAALSILDRMYISDSKSEESEFVGKLDLEWSLNISNYLNLVVKGGGEFRRKIKDYDYNEIYLNIAQDPSDVVNKAVQEKWPWMAEYIVLNEFPYAPFIDQDYDPGDFLGGDFDLERIPSLNLSRELIFYLRDELGVDYSGASQPQRFVPEFHVSKMNDYSGNEEYLAFYFMPNLKFGTLFTFIPGIRYEQNKTDYTAVQGDGGKYQPSVDYNYKNKNVKRENDFVLPMVHARIKPLTWFDIRLSYTQTLARPNYYDFLPKWHISAAPITIEYSNPKLRPAKSENWDLYLSFYGNKVGLLTIGAFSKRIDDLVFYDRRIILSDSMAIADYGLTEEATGYSPQTFKNKAIGSFINNPNETKVWGFEVEWQSNLWYLPGLLKNIVFNLNYTYTKSEATYPRTVPV